MKKTRGLTLIETVIWIAMLTATMLAIVSTLLYFYRTNAYAIEQATAVSSGQRGLEQVIRVIREGAYSSEGAFPIVSISAHEFVFYAEIDSDSLIERVRYVLQGTTLVREVVDATGTPPAYTGVPTSSTVAEYVRNLDQGIMTFRYYD